MVLLCGNACPAAVQLPAPSTQPLQWSICPTASPQAWLEQMLLLQWNWPPSKRAVLANSRSALRRAAVQANDEAVLLEGFWWGPRKICQAEVKMLLDSRNVHHEQPLPPFPCGMGPLCYCHWATGLGRAVGLFSSSGNPGPIARVRPGGIIYLCWEWTLETKETNQELTGRPAKAVVMWAGEGEMPHAEVDVVFLQFQLLSLPCWFFGGFRTNSQPAQHIPVQSPQAFSVAKNRRAAATCCSNVLQHQSA